MSLCCGRFRRLTGWPACGSATRSAHPELITALDKVYVPFTATSISQAAAIASLDAADELLARTDAVVAERARVSAALRAAGFDAAVVAGQLRLAAARAAHTDFVGAGRRRRASWSAPTAADGVRVTIGAPEENDALLEFAAQTGSRGVTR